MIPSHSKHLKVFDYLVDVSKHPLFVGEFSLEVTDCQKYLAGGYAEPYEPPSKNSLWVFRVLKYPKKCLEDLTTFFMSTW